MDQATRVLTAAPRIEALLDDDTPRLTVDVHRLDDPEHIVIDTLIAFIHRTIGWAIGRRVPLVFLEMPYETSPFLRYYEAAFGLLPTEAAAEIAAVIELVSTWQAHFAQVGVSARDIESLAERIDGEHLLAQRTGFNPARFQETPARKKRTSPFRRP
mgnify:CR=1 FL=1